MAGRLGQGPLAARATWLAAAAAARVSPTLSGGPVSRLWFTPWRLPRSQAAREREASWLSQTRPLTVPIGRHRLSGFTAGDGPAVVLVHGWGDRAATMGALVAPLVGAGLRVVGVDLPAHGGSPGRTTNLYEWSDAVSATAEEVGDVVGVVGHSMGAVTAARAVVDGLDVRRVVLLAGPATLADAMEPFTRTLGLPASVIPALRRRIERRFGSQVWDNVALESLAPRVRVPALVVHDRDDEQVSFDQAERVVQALPDAQLVVTDGLGHQRIVRDAAVVGHVTAFLRDVYVAAPVATSTTSPHPRSGSISDM